MSTFLKQLQFYAKNVTGRTLTKHLLSEEFPQSLQDKANQDLSQSQSSNVQSVDTLTKNLSQRKFNPLTDSYSGIHDYE